MKQIRFGLSLLLFVMLCSTNLFGQTTIWSEDFDSESVYNLEDNTNNWQCDISTSSSNDWYVSDGTGDCSSYITSGKALTMYYTTTYECQYYKSDQATDKIAYYATEIDASSYENLTMDFDWICDGESGWDYFKVVYSTNSGVSWTDFSTEYEGYSN
jgi:hypothetical protein